MHLGAPGMSSTSLAIDRPNPGAPLRDGRLRLRVRRELTVAMPLSEVSSSDNDESGRAMSTRTRASDLGRGHSCRSCFELAATV